MPSAAVLHVGKISGPWHFVFESLAYLIAFGLCNKLRDRHGDILPPSQRSSVIVAAILGAAIGSKLLNWLEDPLLALDRLHDPVQLLGGKTITGAILGGTIAVEWTKRIMGIRRRTGDLFAMPLVAGIAVGRIGCFLGGLDDHTYGIATSLPWGVDFGDGVARHPAQIYEILAVMTIGLLLRRLQALPHREGDLYRAFLCSYLLWRFLVDFLKPDPRLLGLTAIQWSSFAALLFYSRDIIRLMSKSGQRAYG